MLFDIQNGSKLRLQHMPSKQQTIAKKWHQGKRNLPRNNGKGKAIPLQA
jgi:hypothetical protein